MRRLIILIASRRSMAVVRSVLIGEHAQCNPSGKCCCTIATDRSQERRFVVGFLRNNIEGTSSSSSVSQITLDRNAGSAGWLNPARKPTLRACQWPALRPIGRPMTANGRTLKCAKHNATKRNIIARRRRPHVAGSLNPDLILCRAGLSCSRQGKRNFRMPAKSK